MFEGTDDILARTARKERLALCDTGMLAVVGDPSRPGDRICRLNGFSNFVLPRKIRGDGNTDYELVGGAFPSLSRRDFERCSPVSSQNGTGDLSQVGGKEFIID